MQVLVNSNRFKIYDDENTSVLLNSYKFENHSKWCFIIQSFTPVEIELVSSTKKLITQEDELLA